MCMTDTFLCLGPFNLMSWVLCISEDRVNPASVNIFWNEEPEDKDKNGESTNMLK